jgi:hypothetical protein
LSLFWNGYLSNVNNRRLEQVVDHRLEHPEDFENSNSNYYYHNDNHNDNHQQQQQQQGGTTTTTTSKAKQQADATICVCSHCRTDRA